ncbi:MAG: toprim domain-containing protein [Endomicrobium sp.]|jgi:phage/plasmid primase-like uncharacterized protein|nr:toprim domain-containing protein [Endomicrobium sp.]
MNNSNFQEIKACFESLSDSDRLDILEELAPGGEVIGGDYVAKCPWRADNRTGSFRIKLSRGYFNDFATGDHGDLISLFVKRFNCTLHEAAKKLSELMKDNWKLAEEAVAPVLKKLQSSMNNRRAKEKKEGSSYKRDYMSSIWEKSSKGEHPYLEEKGISLGNARVNVYKGLNKLVIPLTNRIPQDESKFEIKTAQFIEPSSRKYFCKGLPVKGMFCIASEYNACKDVVFIAEGFATARSIRESTDYYVVASMSANNMKEAALRIRESLPSSKIVICADKDANGAGQKAADKTLQALGSNCQIIFPTQAKDFNEMFLEVGKEKLKEYIQKEIVNGER